jgi:hypothetical protein
MRKWMMNMYMEDYKKTNSADDAEVHRYKHLAEGLEHLHELRHGRRWSWGSSLGLFPSSFWRLSMEAAKQLARRVGGAMADMD